MILSVRIRICKCYYIKLRRGTTSELKCPWNVVLVSSCTAVNRLLWAFLLFKACSICGVEFFSCDSPPSGLESLPRGAIKLWKCRKPLSEAQTFQGNLGTQKNPPAKDFEIKTSIALLIRHDLFKSKRKIWLSLQADWWTPVVQQGPILHQLPLKERTTVSWHWSSMCDGHCNTWLTLRTVVSNVTNGRYATHCLRNLQINYPSSCLFNF